MRNRGIYIIFGGILAVSLFVFFAIARTRAADDRLDVGDPGFYERATSKPTTAQSEDGNLRGIDDAPDNFPNIELASDKVDLGVLSNSEKSVREFMIANTGEAPLIIRQIQTTCACTQGFMSESREPGSGPIATIAPGQSRPMYIEIDPFRINGWEATKHLTIWSNDPKNPKVILEVTSQIEPEFELSALQYDFGRVGRGQNHKANVLLRQVMEGPFDVKGARAIGNAVMPSLPGVTTAAGGEMIPTFELRVIKRAEEQWQTPGKGEWIIELSLSPSLPEGIFNGYYEIETTDDRLDRIQCSFKAQIDSFFRVVPEVIAPRNGLKPGETAAGATRVIAEVPFTISDLVVEGPWFSAAATPEENTNAVRIDITAASDAPPGPKSALVKMKITADDGRVFEHKVGIVVKIHDAAN